MKYLAVIALLFSAGCAAKHKTDAHLVIPPECQGKREVVKGCDPIPNDKNHCLLVEKQEFFCVKVVKP